MSDNTSFTLPKGYDEFQSDLYMWLRADRENTRKIIGYCVTKGYFFMSMSDHNSGGGNYRFIVLSSSMNFQRELRQKLRGIEFTSYMKLDV